MGIEAVAPESRSFNWKDYYTRSLFALEEPLIDYKFDYGVRGIYRDSRGELVVESKVVAPALRRALESTLRHRHPDVFFIDEGQHLAKMSSGQKLQDQLDCLKSLANMTGILHCLIGTYELLTFRNLSGQLSRRSVDIHFPRYQLDNFDDVQAFKSVLLTFQCQMPVEKTPCLVPHWEYCYERTLGCIGILKNWLTRALKDALEEEANTVTLKHLERRAWSVRRDLDNLTLLKWSPVFSQRNLIHPVKKWCSVCYQEQYENSKPIYEQLLWFFKTVDVCPIHKTFLQTSCPHCQQRIPSLARNSRPGYCSHCEQWLGFNNRKNTIPIEDWDLWVGNNVGKILATNSQICEPLYRDRIANSFQKCIEQVTESNITAFARLIKFPKNQVWEWTNGKVVPQLDVLLNISFLMGLSLSDFLTKDDFKTHCLNTSRLNDKRKTKRDKQRFNYSVAETALLDFISDSPKTPISLSAIARQLGYHRRTLTNNFPELCKQISASYLEYKKSLRVQRIKECCLEVEQAVIKLNSEGIYPSEVNVSRILSRPGNLREKEVREALSKARQKLGMNK